MPDAALADAVGTLRAQGRIPMVCCLSRPDRDLKEKLTALGVDSLQQPLKQSTLQSALTAVLGKAGTTPGRRTLDAIERGGAAPQPGFRHRLLLAEDNPVNQRVAVHMLNKLGYAVEVVDNGALAVAAVAGGNFALVLMDCQMPEMDGFAATAAIRSAEAQSRHLPIVAMTANAMQGDRERCLAAGMDDYLAKPIDISLLAEMLSAWLPANVAGPAPPAPPVAKPAEADPDAIDMQRLTDLFGADDAVIDELLTVFQQSLRPLRERLRHEVLGRGSALKAITHELRGAAANVGASPMSELAGRLENMVPGGNWSEIEPQAALVDREFDRIDGFVDRYAQRGKV
jgi:CheY-like chemotaxis protein/HPt (histidine-containing phosphotransfer) domain-containing protein